MISCFLQESSAHSAVLLQSKEGKLHCQLRSLAARILCARIANQDLGSSGSEFSVNRDQRIKTAILAVIIAHKSILRSNFDVAVSPVTVNKDGTNRCRIRVANWQSFES